MTITLPDNIPAVQGMSEQELMAELAVSLYAARRLTLVQAADLARCGLLDFQRLLKEHGVPQYYDEAALQEDLQALAKLPQ